MQSEERCDTCLRPIESKKEAKQIKKLRQIELNDLKKKYNIITKKLKNSEIAFNNLE